MMIKEGFTKIVNFMIPGAGYLVLWRGHIRPFKLKYMCAWKGLFLFASFLYHFLIFSYSSIGLLMCMTRSQCRVSNTQVFDKACGSLLLDVIFHVHGTVEGLHKLSFTLLF